MSELEVVKQVDRASPTLMHYLRSHKVVGKAILTVRKAGTKPLDYVKIELESVVLTSLNVETKGAELIERLRLGFGKVRVSYTPQDSTGAVGGGENVFEADAFEGF